MGNTAQHCRLGLFQESDIAGHLEDSNRASTRVFCIFGSRTFVPVSWMCKKQSSVSQSSTESEIISLDAGLRMDGLLALDLWDTVTEVLRSTNNTVQPNHSGLKETCARPKSKTKTPTDNRRQKVDQVSKVDYVTTKANSSQGESQLYIFWRQWSCHQNDYQRTKSNDETLVKNPQSCAWLVVRQNLLRTQGSNIIHWHQDPTRRHSNERKFSRDEWNHPLRLFNIVSFSMFSCSHFSDFLSDDRIGKESAMSKRGQEATSGEGSPMAKPKPTIPAKGATTQLGCTQPEE